MRKIKANIKRNNGNADQGLFGFVARVDADETMKYLAWLEAAAVFNGLEVKVTL